MCTKIIGKKWVHNHIRTFLHMQPVGDRMKTAYTGARSFYQVLMGFNDALRQQHNVTDNNMTHQILSAI